MTDFTDFSPALRDALKIWADVTFGNHTVHPEMKEEFLVEKPADVVVAGDSRNLDASVWVHEGFDELVNRSDRAAFEADPTEEEIGLPERRESLRSKKANDPVRYVDASLQLHFTPSVANHIHSVHVQLMEDEAIKEINTKSDIENLKFVAYYTLSRTDENTDSAIPNAWRVPRFKPSELLTALENVDSGQFRVVSIVTPLQ